MIFNKNAIDPILLQEASYIIEGLFGSVKINSVKLLSEPERRNIILRLTLTTKSSTIPKSIILKQALPDKLNANENDRFARFARDWAALEFLSLIQKDSHTVPKFYGSNKNICFILIEDLGEEHISLVDSLTMNNRDKAVLALKRFMKALGNFHASSFGYLEKYQMILNKIDDEPKTWEDDLFFTIDDLVTKLKLANHKFGLLITPNILDEVRYVIESMFKPGPLTVLVHGDICPDNVFDHSDTDRLQLIDFEWSFYRNALLDGTYLRMNMPTCWCAKAIPENIIESVESIYREELKLMIPAASDDLIYSSSYLNACAFWLLRAMPFVEDALYNDEIWSSGPVPKNSLWKPEDNLIRPRLLSRLQTFINLAHTCDKLPHLRQMASSMLKEAKIRWPEAKPLELYSAFQ